MSLKQRLTDLAGSVGLAATNAPNNYAEWSSWTYESHKTDLKELWAEIRPQLKRDIDKAEFVDSKLQQMFEAFDAGENDKGRDAAWAIYNLNVEGLR